jgi:3-isopropylmalate/(R)-2-methylmalate dehydratase small subunit
LQSGIRAIVAPSLGEIFYSSAMNNQLLLAPVPQATVDDLLADLVNPMTNWVTIDIQERSVRSRNHSCSSALSARHQQMFVDGLDLVGASLSHQDTIAACARTHWAKQPWPRAVAASTRKSLI